MGSLNFQGGSTYDPALSANGGTIFIRYIDNRLASFWIIIYNFIWNEFFSSEILLRSYLSIKHIKNPQLVASTDGVGTKIEIANELKIFDSIGSKPNLDF